MSVPKGVLAKIIAERPDGVPLEDWIAVQLGAIDRVAREHAEILRERAAEDGRHCEAVARLRERESALRNGCPHWATEFVPAHEDSHYECLHCGREIP